MTPKQHNRLIDSLETFAYVSGLGHVIGVLAAYCEAKAVDVPAAAAYWRRMAWHLHLVEEAEKISAREDIGK